MLNFDVGQRLPVLLLVDDDVIAREVAATVLTMSGYQVFTAECGQSALAKLEFCKPDVILMDAQMPGLCGVELICSLRQRVPAVIVVISASETLAEVIEAADGFLLKPFDAAALVELLRKGGHSWQAAGEPRSHASKPVVDEAMLQQLRSMMSAGAVQEIMVAVEADLKQRAEALEVSIGLADLAEVRRIGHAIKGGCGMAGAAEAAQIGAQLENSDQLDDSLSLLRELRAATARLGRILDTEFEKT